MPIFRSETMKHGTLVVPSERARNVLYELGKQTAIQFEDMNASSMNRAYKPSVQRIEECERIVRYLHEQVDSHLDGSGEEVKKNPQEFLETRPEYRFEEVEMELKRAYGQLQSARENHRSIGEQYTRTLEEKYVVHVTVTQLTYEQMQGGQSSNARGLLASPAEFADMTGAAGPAFSNIAGVLGQADQERFARALFRMSRGNTFTSFHPIAEPIADFSSGKPIRKSVFVVYFQGRSTSVMADKVRLICTAFGGNLYPWQQTIAAAEQRFTELNEQLKDSKVSQDAYLRFLAAEIDTLLVPARAGGNALIEDWRVFLTVEKSIYATLNMFEGTEHTLKGDCWYAESDEDMIRRVLMDEGARADGVSAMLLGEDNAVEHADAHDQARNPPTHIRGNEFTVMIQDVIDTYGTPRYKEANPMLLSLVTFPFIFGVMFGDVGHGLLLFLAGTILCLRGKKLLHIKGMFEGYGRQMFEVRYCILMMGFFAMYAGLMYNDFLSTGLDLFGSRYTPGEAKPGQRTVEWVPNFDTTNTGLGPGPYPFGLDPAWHGAQNELLYVNSMKMKIAVLLGVAQMVVGICLSFSNGFYDKNKTDIFFVCCPQMIFMVLFFGYMDYMILYKWTNVTAAPSIINAMISMGLGQALPNPLFAGQETFHSYNLIALGLCVPWMLFPKPIILYMEHQKQAQYQRLDSDQKEVHFDMAELCIHQVIETIEFVLGSISHTASYLRLWALSLAHQQLSLVFFQKTIIMAMCTGSALTRGIALFVAMAVFLCITTGILMGMDFLECFLHTLRLHWVEFQSKFYKADGHAFRPYSHERIVLSNCGQ